MLDKSVAAATDIQFCIITFRSIASSLNLFNLTGMAFLLHFIPVSSQIIIS